jgi:hypothetical protein
MDIKKEEHQDLEERFQISADVEFSFSSQEFETLQPMNIEVKKKKETKQKIENVELRKSTGGLF